MNMIDTAKYGSFEEFKAVYKKEELNSYDSYGYTCLHNAIGGHHWDTVNFLLMKALIYSQLT